MLQQRIHERSIFRQPVVQVRSGSQTARPDASDRLPLLNPDTGMNAGRKRRQGRYCETYPDACLTRTIRPFVASDVTETTRPDATDTTSEPMGAP